MKPAAGLGTSALAWLLPGWISNSRLVHFSFAEIAVRRMCSPETNFADGSIDSDREAGGAVGAVAQLPLELRQRLTIGDHLKPGGQRLPGVMSCPPKSCPAFGVWKTSFGSGRSLQ